MRINLTMMLKNVHFLTNEVFFPIIQVLVYKFNICNNCFTGCSQGRSWCLHWAPEVDWTAHAPSRWRFGRHTWPQQQVPTAADEEIVSLVILTLLFPPPPPPYLPSVLVSFDFSLKKFNVYKSCLKVLYTWALHVKLKSSVLSP